MKEFIGPSITKPYAIWFFPMGTLKKLSLLSSLFPQYPENMQERICRACTAVIPELIENARQSFIYNISEMYGS